MWNRCQLVFFFFLCTKLYAQVVFFWWKIPRFVQCLLHLVHEKSAVPSQKRGWYRYHTVRYHRVLKIIFPMDGTVPWVVTVLRTSYNVFYILPQYVCANLFRLHQTLYGTYDEKLIDKNLHMYCTGWNLLRHTIKSPQHSLVSNLST